MDSSDELLNIAYQEADKEIQRINALKAAGDEDARLQRMLSVVRDTVTKQIFIRISGQPLPEKTELHKQILDNMPLESYEPWEITNCAEIKACNDALHARRDATLSNLEGVTIIIKKKKPKERCRNCKQALEHAIFYTDPGV